MPKKPCLTCGVLVDKGSYCSAHRPVAPSTQAWSRPGAAKVRQQVLDRDHHICVRCGSELDLEVHHRIAAADGGPLELWNLEAVCGECHRRAHKLSWMSPT